MDALVPGVTEELSGTELAERPAVDVLAPLAARYAGGGAPVSDGVVRAMPVILRLERPPAARTPVLEAAAAAALDEGGWGERFLAERGPLLPADEAELAASWVTVVPGLYEVERVHFGEGVTLRDLRGDGRVDVRPTTGVSPEMGELVLARALPDGSGSGHLLVGAVAVPRGAERELLAQLGDPDR